MWAIGHQNYCIGLDIKSYLSVGGAAQHVLWCAHVCLSERNYEGIDPCPKLEMGHMHVPPSLWNQHSFLLIYVFKFRSHKSLSSEEFWKRDSRNMKRGFKEILRKRIHTDCKYYFFIWWDILPLSQSCLSINPSFSVSHRSSLHFVI